MFGISDFDDEATDAHPTANEASPSNDPALKVSSPAVATAVRLLMQSVTVRRRGLTDVIALEATAKTPERAAQIANTYAEAYLEEQVAAKLAGIERASIAISRRLAELDEELKRSESQIGTRQIYQDNVQRFKAIAQRRETVAPNSRVASRARAPDIPSFPRPALFVLLGAMMSSGRASRWLTCEMSIPAGFTPKTSSNSCPGCRISPRSRMSPRRDGATLRSCRMIF